MEKKSKAGRADRTIASITLVFVALSAVLAVACIYYSHLVQAAVIIVADIAIVGVLLLVGGKVEPRRMAKDGKGHDDAVRQFPHKPNKRFDAGVAFVRCKGVQWQWSLDGSTAARGEGDKSVVTFGEKGVRFESGRFADGYPWDEMVLYQKTDEGVIIGMQDASSIAINGIKPLKRKAVVEQMTRHDVNFLSL